MKRCYCGGPEQFERCCRPLLSGEKQAETPEQLMRSRYSAFCVKNAEYLFSSLHPDFRSGNEMETLRKSLDAVSWEGLIVIAVDDDRLSSGVGYVEFAAFYQAGGPDQLHEKSRFVREGDTWYYCDGQILPPLVFKRNQPCWCMSGRKYKRCHGK